MRARATGQYPNADMSRLHKKYPTLAVIPPTPDTNVHVSPVGETKYH